MSKREIKNKTSNNIRTGKLKERELYSYELNEKQVNIILEYQKKLPILQENNDNWINTRDLHKQLLLSRQYDKWITNIFEQLDLEKSDIKTTIVFKDYAHKFTKEQINNMNSQQKSANGISTDYYVTIENAKEIAMIAGVGNRVNKETKDISKIARKYFIYIEQAFKSRLEWNYDRDDTLIKCKTLKKAIMRFDKDLETTKPTYMKNNFVSEFCLLNEAIIKMSATQYRQANGLKKSDSIRNTFSERTLELVYELEVYDADLIMINNEFNREKRLELLKKKFDFISNSKAS